MPRETIKFNATKQMDKVTVLNLVSISIILLAPLLRRLGLSFELIGNTGVRLVLIIYIIYASSVDVFSGILAFLAAFTLLLERNHGILTGFPNQKAEIPIKNYRVEEVPVGTPSLVEREPDIDENNAEHMNDNIPRLTSVPKGTASVSFYKERSLV
jgi:hypothetical protein